MFKILVPCNPTLEGLGELVRVEPPDQLLAALCSMLLVIRVISPDGEGPLNIFLAIAEFDLPDGLESLVFGSVYLIGIHPLEPPCVEYLLKELPLFELLCQASLLNLGLQGLKCPLVPLFDCNFLSIFSKTLQNSNELSQRAVAFFIKPTVMEELVESSLLAILKHLLERDKHDFGDQELVMVPIVA